MHVKYFLDENNKEMALGQQDAHECLIYILDKLHDEFAMANYNQIFLFVI